MVATAAGSASAVASGDGGAPQSRHHRVPGSGRGPPSATLFPCDDDGPPVRSSSLALPDDRVLRAAAREVRKAKAMKRKYLYRTDAGSSAPRATTARFGAPLPGNIPSFPLLLTLPLAAHVQSPLVLGRPTPHAVHLVRRERVLQALSPHLAGGADRLRLSYLSGARPARRHGEEKLRIRFPAGGQLPPVAPLLLKRGTLGW